MSVLTMVLLAAVALYLVTFFGRLCRLVWVEGAKGNEIDANDTLRMFGRDVWKAVTLPSVVFEAARKR